MYKDLKNETISKVSKKWERYFKTHPDFFLDLANVFEKELKVYAIPAIFESSEFGPLIK